VPDREDVDVLVVGGGAAGARAAIEAHDCGASVVLACKGPLARSGTTPQAWPSMQVAFGAEDPRDGPGVHFHDTVREGRMLGDENLVWALVSDAQDRVRDLERYGVKFERKNGQFLQVRHPGQTYPRNLVIKGAGYGLVSGLSREVRRRASIRVMPDAILTRLLLAEGRAVGATVLDLRRGLLAEIRAKATVLCTGGYEQLWGITDTSPDTTGDGIALAYRAGAELVDMEMMLYYPAVIVHSYGELNGTLVQYESLLAAEYLAGRMLNANGEEFLPPGPPPARDILSRLMFDEIRAGRGTKNGALRIDLTKSPKSPTEIDDWLDRLQTLPYDNLRELGIDVKAEAIEVAPGTHFALGGIHINERCETTVPGLYAAGEVAGNLHGANRVSGNALTETQVFGARAGRSAAQEAAHSTTLCEPDPDHVTAEHERVVSLMRPRKDGLRPLAVRREIKALMDRYVGMPRDSGGLTRALGEVRRLRSEDLPRVQVEGPLVFNNEWREAIEVDLMLDTAETVIVSALLRTESRGHHQRSDYPKSSDQWLRHTAVRSVDSGLASYVTEVTRSTREP